MSDVEAAYAYLTIPADYSMHFDGVCWSAAGDALEYEDCLTFAVADQVELVLEGVLAGPTAPPFAWAVGLFAAMNPRAGRASALPRLADAYHRVRRTPEVMRNAGRLIAELCRDMPAVSPVPTLAKVRLAISRRRLFGDPGKVVPGVLPPLSPDEFVRAAGLALERLDDAALVHWLKHGCGPVGAGKELAEPLDTLPRRLAKLLEMARQSSRLVGAAALTPALDGALTLPPRRRSRAELPQGGYSDVANRGDPDRLLPSQLALDADEFVRRFAERELLFFEREEPQTVQAPERLVVLDQGVRTWGGVRLALAGAALSLVRCAGRRASAVRLVTTSGESPLDLASGDLAAVVARLEASDLTENPADCLKQVLATNATAPPPRDVILLTHPRALREPAVIAAANGRGPADRLFTLAVDAKGRAELGEWSPAGPVVLRTFRVDLAAAEAARVTGSATPRPSARPASTIATTAWTGDVEPVHFPFRPGLVSEPVAFGFSADGDWLAAAAKDGTLHGIAADGSTCEVLPRAFAGGFVLKQVEAVLGLASGVAVCGRMPIQSAPTVLERITSQKVSSASEVFVAAVYRRAERSVQLVAIAPVGGPVQWFAHTDLNCLVLRSASGGRPITGCSFPGCAFDVATGGCYPLDDSPQTDRARQAWIRWQTGCWPRNLIIRMAPSPLPEEPSGPVLRQENGILHFEKLDQSIEPFEPMRDGKPLLANTRVERAQLAGDVLAMTTHRGPVHRLVLCRTAGGAVLLEGDQVRANAPFALSRDGERIAYHRGKRGVRILETGQTTGDTRTIPHARLHTALRIEWSWLPFSLTIGVGSVDHCFTLIGETLIHSLGTPKPPRLEPRSGQHTGLTRYDWLRFLPLDSNEASPLRAVFDRLGQVLLISREGELIASFLVRRDKVAVALPGSPEPVFWGDAGLIGGPPTPDAARKIGLAIAAHLGGKT